MRKDIEEKNNDVTTWELALVGELLEVKFSDSELEIPGFDKVMIDDIIDLVTTL